MEKKREFAAQIAQWAASSLMRLFAISPTSETKGYLTASTTLVHTPAKKNSRFTFSMAIVFVTAATTRCLAVNTYSMKDRFVLEYLEACTLEF